MPYFSIANLRQCVDLLLRLLGSVVEAIHFFRPWQCALSVVEGNSTTTRSRFCGCSHQS